MQPFIGVDLGYLVAQGFAPADSAEAPGHSLLKIALREVVSRCTKINVGLRA
jgi:hypothetical protein